jgi:ribosomal RNA-processing protein 1
LDISTETAQEKKTRDKAIKNLSAFLSDPSRDEIPRLDMDRLWKGIFYGFWMSDKPLVQQALANELADLVLTISATTSSIGFLRGFWQTIVREWNGIDRLRYVLVLG